MNDILNSSCLFILFSLSLPLKVEIRNASYAVNNEKYVGHVKCH